jgi:hypothetical protein
MKSRIDWHNHLVAFVSTLLGIFIAFQLEDWQEQRKSKESLAIVLEAIKQEVQSNVRIYQNNVTRLSEFLAYQDFYEKHSDEKGNIITTQVSMAALMQNHQHRLNDVKITRALNDSINIYSGAALKFDIIPETGVSTVSWQAATSSGLLTALDHETLSQLIDIYGWIERDMGMSESQFYHKAIGISEFDDFNQIISNYKHVVRNTEFKLARIEKPLKRLKW